MAALLAGLIVFPVLADLPLITSVSPTQVSAGTSVGIGGSGFTGTSEVLFINQSLRGDASFSSISDSMLSAMAPSLGTSPYSPDIAVFTGSGATVTIFPGYTDVTGTTVSGAAGTFLVENGGMLSGGFGGSLIYVESGGTYTDTGGGGNTVFVENGGAFTDAGGGGSATYYAPSATIVNSSGGGGNTFTQVAALQPSILTPEPVSIGLITLLAGWGLRRKRH
jgi:hypothetical protein